MVKVCIKMYSAAVAAASNIASVIIPQDLQLVAVQFAFRGTIAGAVGNSHLYQLSTQSTGQFALNDARNIIAEFAASGDKAAGFNVASNCIIQTAGLKFFSGDKIYMHMEGAANFSVAQVNVNLLLV